VNWIEIIGSQNCNIFQKEKQNFIELKFTNHSKTLIYFFISFFFKN